MKEMTNHHLSRTPYIDKYTTDLTEKIKPKRQDFVRGADRMKLDKFLYH